MPRRSATRKGFICALQGCEGRAHQAKRWFMYRFTHNPG
jgi:hypothetical protein